MTGQHPCRHCNALQPEGALRCGECGESLARPDAEHGRYIGQMISQRYRVVERLARGGMGEVYVAEHVEMRQLVAVKFLHRRYAHEESFATRFFNEARYAAQVTHPNAVALYDFGRLPDGTLFIVMEYVRGESLSRVVRNQGMIPVPMAMRIGSQIAEVLASAHDKRIIHRDVKPDNIMLVQGVGNRVAVKVLDFGIAKILDDEDGNHTEPGVMFGTPEYMSPEQALGRPYDHRVDVYALGLVFYYMLAGAPPFSGTNKIAVLQAQVQQQAPPIEKVARQPIPKPLARMIGRMLEKDPSKRQSSMVEVLQDLDAILQGGDTDALYLSEEPTPRPKVVEVATSMFAPAEVEDELSFESIREEASELLKSKDYRLDIRPVEKLTEAEADDAWASSLPSELGARAVENVPALEPMKSSPTPNANLRSESSAAATNRRVSAEDYTLPIKVSEGEIFAPIQRVAEEKLMLSTGPIPIQREPWSLRASTTTALRVLRRESGAAIAVAILASALVILVSALVIMRPVDGEESIPEVALTDAQREAFALAEVRRSISAGELAAARSTFDAIEDSETEAYEQAKASLELAERLVGELTAALEERRCDDARVARVNISRELSNSLAARFDNGLLACAPSVGSGAVQAAAQPARASQPVEGARPVAAQPVAPAPPTPVRTAPAPAPTPVRTAPVTTSAPSTTTPRPATTTSTPAARPAATAAPSTATTPTPTARPAAAPSTATTTTTSPSTAPTSVPSSSSTTAPSRLPDLAPSAGTSEPASRPATRLPDIVLPDEL